MLGIDAFLGQSHRFMGLSFALFSNQSSFTTDLIPSELALAEVVNLVGIISPQHGFFHEAQANMRETAPIRHPLLGVPIHPFYSAAPQLPPFLEDFDLLLVDIQDVGVRVYTYIWSLLQLMKALSGKGKVVFVLDRPNPLGGEMVEGNPLDMEYSSMVGMMPIPMIHGMTVGELALMFSEKLGLDLELEVFKAEWRRSLDFSRLGLPWRNPSPNLPTYASARVYGGTVLLEGTNISEGRGTTRPFQYIGAPFVDPYRLWKEVESLEGARFFPVGFTPTFDKYQGQPCFGVEIIPVAGIRPLRLGLLLLKKIFSLWPSGASFLPPPYEYEEEKLPIDIIAGSPRYRKWLLEGEEGDLDALLSPAPFDQERLPYLLYP